MAKSADAFRTISEVAEILQVPAHVLRFWESRFTQVKPVKRAGGRRYYRPDDIRLLSGIRKLLHDDGMTIKGVQKILREHGVRHVADMAPAVSEIQSGMPDTDAPGMPGAEVLSFDRRSGTETEPPDTDPDSAPDISTPSPDPAPQEAQQTAPDPAATQPPEPAPDPIPAEPEGEGAPTPSDSPDAPAAAPPLPPLPDLPDDPGDTGAARPGALSALAGLHGPLPTDLATRLAAIAERLRGRDTQQTGSNAAPNQAPNHATGD